MFEPHVPPPMNVRTWLVLLCVATATIYLGLNREAGAGSLDTATAAAVAPIAADALEHP